MKYREKLLKLGLNIAYYRKLKSYSQEQLAEKTGISVSFISKLENPNVFIGISFENICKISNALGIKESSLLDFRDTDTE